MMLAPLLPMDGLNTTPARGAQHQAPDRPRCAAEAGARRWWPGSFAETIGLTTDDEAGLVYVSILRGDIRMVLMSHDCPVAQLPGATTITHKSVALQ
ncbi:MAG TPA: hypothetical protein VI194_02000 [Mycobacterium sp.]|jgi:hypothetical protein